MNKVLVGFFLLFNCFVCAADQLAKGSPEDQVARLDSYFQAHRSVGHPTRRISLAMPIAFTVKPIALGRKDYASQNLAPSFADTSNAESSSQSSSSSVLPYILIPAFFALAGGIALGVNVSVLAGVLGGLAIGLVTFGFAALVNLFSQPSDSPC